MEHTLDINRKTILSFVEKSGHFLNLPRKLFECDVAKCNPSLYRGKKGIAAIKRAKKGLIIVARIEKDLAKLRKILKTAASKTKSEPGLFLKCALH